MSAVPKPRGAGVPVADPQVVAKAKRRTFTAAFKAKVLAEYDAAPDGSKGAVLRRHGLYSSHVTDWRRHLDAGALTDTATRRGRPAADGRDKELARLRRENDALAERLRKAELVIEVQGKVHALLESLSESASPRSDGPNSSRGSRR